MTDPRALKDFISFSDAKFENKSLTVYAALNGNTYFPNPLPAMSELNAGIQQYSAALSMSKNRDRIKVEEKKVLRKKLEGILTALVNYVNHITNGNRTMLLSTGFTVSTETASAPVFTGEIDGLKIGQGANSGELAINFKPVTAKRVYVFCYAETPVQNDCWKVVHGIRPGLTITGLQRGKEYDVRVGVVGPDGQTIYAAAVTILVL